MKYSYRNLKSCKERDSLILQKCKNKIVLHLGATDAPYTKKKLDENLLLHTHIDKVSKKNIGLDIDQDSIDFLSSRGIKNIEYFDMNNLGDLDLNVDIIIFGEIIEHLENLNIAFENIKKVMSKETKLIISTPNLFYINNALEIIFKNREFVHHDHKLGFTYGLIKQLLNSNGLEIFDFYFTFLPRTRNKFSRKIIKLLCTLRPSLSENLLVIAKLKDST